MRNPLLFAIFFASMKGRAEFKPSVFDTSPWLPIGEASKNLWQPLLEKLNQGRQSKSLVKDALVLHQDIKKQNFASVGNEIENTTNVLSPAELSNSTPSEKFESTDFQKNHKNLKRRKKSERYGARLSPEEMPPVHKVFPNDPKYPSDHDFKEDPIFVVLDSSHSSGQSHKETRISRSPFLGGAGLDNR